MLDNALDSVIVTAITDPFKPHTSRLVKRIDFVPGMTAEECVHELYPLAPDDFDIVLAIDGRIVTPDTPVSPGENVVFTAVLEGGNSGRIAAMLAVLAAATIVSGGLGAGIGGTVNGFGTVLNAGLFGTGTMSAKLLGAGLMIGGGLLINAVLPPSSNNNDTGSSDSPTYNWAYTNAFREGVRWPVLYGTKRIKPPVLSKYIESDGTRSYLNILFAVADHPVDSISDIEINDTNIANFNKVTTTIRLGDNNNEVIPHFSETISQTALSSKVVEAGESIVVTTLGNTANHLGVGLLWPQGVYSIDEDGKTKNSKIEYRVYYRKVGDATWNLAHTQESGWDERKPYRRFHRINDVEQDYYEIKVDYVSYHGKGDTKNGEVGKQLHVEFINEYIDEGFIYPGCALMAVRALATDQLSGTEPKITMVATRSNVSTAGGDKSANNPSWAAYDMHADEFYGGGIALSRLIYDDFNEWATECTTQGFELNAYFDSREKFVQALSVIEHAGRGRVVQRGTDFGVVIDRQLTGLPQQMFNIDNIVANSFKMSYVQKQDRTNVIQVSYFDANDRDRQTTVQVTASDYNPSVAEPVIQEILLRGCTDKELAMRHGKFLLNCNQLFLRDIEFEVAADAIGCIAGDVVSVSFDAIKWGQGGRVISATANSATLNREITIEAGNTYKARVWHTDDSMEEVTLTGLGTMSTITLSGVWAQIPSANAKITVGISERLVRPFRVYSITRGSGTRRKIKALEYADAAYNDTVVVPPDETPSSVVWVANLTAYEDRIIVDGLAKVVVQLAWRGEAFRWDVYYRNATTGGPWQYVGDTSVPDYIVENVFPGSTYDFAVCVAGRPPESGETVTLTVTGGGHDGIPDLPISPVHGLQISQDGNNGIWWGRDLHLTWYPVSETWTPEADGDPAGAGSFPEYSAQIVYRIAFYDAAGTMLRSQLPLYKPAYVYTWESNWQDTGGSPSPVLTVKVWARTANGVECEVPAVLHVVNPAPDKPTNLTANPYLGGVRFTWDNARTQIPDYGSYEYRFMIEGSGWTKDWTGVPIYECDVNTISISIDDLNKADNKLWIYFQIRTKDTFGNTSDWADSTQAESSSFFIYESELATDLITKINNIPDEARIDQAEIDIDNAEAAIAQAQTDLSTVNGRVTQNETDITQNNQQIQLKATQVDLNAVDGRVTTAESNITINANAILLKADQTEVDTIEGRVTAAEGSITVNAGNIALKASQTEVDTIEGRVTSAEAAIDVNAGDILLRAEKTEIDGIRDHVDHRVAELRLNADQFTVKIDSNGYVAGMGLTVYPDWSSTTTYQTGEFVTHFDPIINNSDLSGTTGTKGPRVTGSVADQMTVWPTGSVVSCVASKNASDQQELDVTGTDADEYMTLMNSYKSPGVTKGHRYRIKIIIESMTLDSGTSPPRVFAWDNSGGNINMDEHPLKVGINEFVYESLYTAYDRLDIKIFAGTDVTLSRMEVDDLDDNDYIVYKSKTDSNIGNEPYNATHWEIVTNGAKSEFVILADKFAIIKPDGTGGVSAPFIVDSVTSTVGINGSLLVNGSSIQLSEGGEAIFGDQNVIIETKDTGTEGSLIVAPNGGITNNHHLKMSAEELSLMFWDGTSHQEYTSIQRLEWGTANSGDTVTIPGLFRRQPYIQLSPCDVPCFSAANSSQDQRLRLRVESLAIKSGETYVWQFVPRAELVVDSNISSGAPGELDRAEGTSYEDYSTLNSEIVSTVITCAAGTTKVTVNMRLRGCKINHDADYDLKAYHRRPLIKYDLVSNTGTWLYEYGDYVYVRHGDYVTVQVTLSAGSAVNSFYAGSNGNHSVDNEYKDQNNPPGFYSFAEQVFDSYTTEQGSVTIPLTGQINWEAKE